MTGETVAGYIRKRRLSEAARKLITTLSPILDLAFDYQFESQEAFTRSFKKQFRFSPAAYRQRGRFTNAFQRITLCRRRIYRLHQATPHLLPHQEIVPAQLFTLLMKHPIPGLRARPTDTLYLWYT
jgi:hypothetical protein